MKKIIIPTLLLSIISCQTDFETDVKDMAISQGEADFSNYVALGNSLTSGYRDGTLYLDGQVESYPNIIATQMQRAGGGTFTQPLMPNNIGGFTDIAGFNGKLTLQLVNGNLTPAPSAPAAALDKLSGSFNNMGVPGAKSFHLVTNGYGALNPFFTRFASSTTTSVLADAMAQKPTFFSLWIGNNDVLSYATSGGTGTDQTGNYNPATYGSNDITDPQVLTNSIKAIIDGMISAGATKGVIANIPNVTDIPFFTTVPYNAIPLNNEQAQALNNNLLNNLKTALTALGAGDRINLAVAGQNPVLIKDKDLTDLSPQITEVLTSAGLNTATATQLGAIYGQARHATSEDYVLLTTRSVINSNPSFAPTLNYGISYPLEDAHILTATEISKIQTATNAYNAQIKALADAYGLAFVDANAKMAELSQNSGITFNGVNYTTTFVTGGAFSLDGVHLTGRGYAVIANEFIKAINGKYKSTLPQVNPNNYSGITFP